MAEVKIGMVCEAVRKWKKKQALITDETSSFFIYRTDSNQVLARGVIGYEAAKDKANDLRRRLNLKWDDIKFRKETSRQKSQPTSKQDRSTRNRMLMSNPKYASPQRDRYSLSGRGGSRSYTHHKDWDE